MSGPIDGHPGDAMTVIGESGSASRDLGGEQVCMLCTVAPPELLLQRQLPSLHHQAELKGKVMRFCEGM